jgi:hypothetical protein
MAARRITRGSGELLSPVTLLRVSTAAFIAAALTCLGTPAATADTTPTTVGEQSVEQDGTTPSAPESEPADEPSEESSEPADEPSEEDPSEDEPSEGSSEPADEPSQEEPSEGSSEPADEPSQEEPSEDEDPERTGTLNGEDEEPAEPEASEAARAAAAAEPLAVDDTAVVRAGGKVRVRVIANDVDAAGATVTIRGGPRSTTRSPSATRSAPPPR